MSTECIQSDVLWVLLYAPWIQSTARNSMSLRTVLPIISHLRVDLPSGLFPAGFPTNSLYAFLLSALRHTERICDLVNLVTFGEDWEPWSSSLHDCLVPLITCAPLIEHHQLYFPPVWEMRLHTIIIQQPNYKCLYLTLNIPVVCVCAASFNVKNCIFPTQCIRVLM
jgi:hypothetical protein